MNCVYIVYITSVLEYLEKRYKKRINYYYYYCINVPHHSVPLLSQELRINMFGSSSENSGNKTCSCIKYGVNACIPQKM